MQVEGWKYYNHAMIPTTVPNDAADMRPIESGVIWKKWGGYSSTGEMDNRLGLRP